MAEYNEYSLTIILEKDGSLEQRIQRLAEKRNVTFQEALESVIQLGLWKFMERNMDTYERVYDITT